MTTDSKYEAFLAEQEQDEWPARAEIISAFRSLLLEPSVPVSTIAKEGMSRVIAEANPTPEYGDVWSVLLPAVKRFPEQCDRLVEFVVALQQLPDCNGEFEYLDGLTIYLTEFTFGYSDHSFNATTRDKERQGFVNANIFTAKLYHRLPRNRFGLLIGYGWWVLRRTLEYAPWEKFHYPKIEEYIQDIDDDFLYSKARDEELEMIDIRSLNGFVPAAAVWIEYCGKEIYMSETSLGDETPAYDLWKGPAGWSKARWAFWKERFELISTFTALDRKTRRIAKRILEQMGKIEQEEYIRLS